MAPQNGRYTPVPDDEANTKKESFDYEQGQDYYKPNNTSKLRNIAFFVIPTIVSLGTVFALLVMASIFKHSLHIHHENDAAAVAGAAAGDAGTYQPTDGINSLWRSCGATATEARTRGCIFDTIAFAWLLPECYDGELIEEFSHLQVHFPFFADPAGTVEMPWSEVVKGERAMYVPWSHHLWHCGFMFRKMHRAIMTGKPVDSYVGNYTHTEHCTQIMVEENAMHAMEEVNTIMALKFPYCGPGRNQWVGGTNFTIHTGYGGDSH